MVWRLISIGKTLFVQPDFHIYEIYEIIYEIH
jgi:hypothetical protein